MPGRLLRFRFRPFFACFLLGIALCFGLHQPLNASTPAPAVGSPQPVQQGIERYQAGDYPGAIKLWQAALATYRQLGDRTNSAIVLENLARAYQHLGQTTAELDAWTQLIALQRQSGAAAEIPRLRVEQAQALSRDGQFRKAIEVLCGANTITTCTPESALQQARAANQPMAEIAALGSLGDTYRLIGEYQPAIAALKAGLKLAQVHHHSYEATLLQTLGTVHSRLAQVEENRVRSAEQRGASKDADKFRQRQQAHKNEARQSFQQSLERATRMDPATQLRSRLAMMALDPTALTNSPATDVLQQLTQELKQLPDSRERVYMTIDLARLYLQGTQGGRSRFSCAPTAPSSPGVAQAQALLVQAVEMAQKIADQRAQSFALGELGHWYECQQQYDAALSQTRNARYAAEPEPDSRYLWEWQAGRILQAQGNFDDAIGAYNTAIATIATIRKEILTMNRDVQFDFRDTIEPMYRESIVLQLAAEDRNLGQPLEPTADKTKTLNTRPNAQSTQSSPLNTVLNTVDSLRVAELQNYFGNDCVSATISPDSVRGQLAMQATAIFNSIILDDRTVIIVHFPDKTQKKYVLAMNRSALQQEVNAYRRDLERFTDDYTPQRAQQLYNWIIRPFAEDLQRTGVKTLLFVQDGILRTVPMAALHDGQQFLVQQYAIVTAPSLSLMDLQVPNRQALRSLAMGVTQAATVDGQPFERLPNVEKELQAIKKLLPDSEMLQDQDFTRDRLEQSLRQRPFPILHIATHGQFGTDPADTFLLLGNRQKLTITELDTLIRQYGRGREAIDLLTLTACQTAVGDDRAALGLAGVAFQAGVKSALASLWFVNDAATAEFATYFYDSWRNTKLSKAEAVQKAQQALIASKEYAHPAYWAPFLLVGNWL